MRNQGTDRPVARPQQPVSPPEATAVRPQMPRPEARPQRPIVAPRVAEPVRPEGQCSASAQGAVNQNDNRCSQGWSHPQAKPAPPVQERNPAQARDDENKFRNWQQQRQQAAPAQNRAPQEQHQAPHQAPQGPGQAAKIAELSSSAVMKLPVSKPGTGNFLCVPPNRRLHDRLLGTGN